jgi:hypothetical protein
MRAICLCLLVVVGCTSNSTSSSVSGDMPGGNFDLADTISASVTSSDGAGGSSSDARIVMGSTAQLCSDASASPPVDRKQQHYISIVLRDVNGAMTTAPVAPGTYTIYPDSGNQPAKSASLLTGAFDDTCQSIDDAAAAAKSGTVTLTTITGGAFAGTFDVVLSTDGHITGSFDPAPCPGLQAAATSTAAHACK